MDRPDADTQNGESKREGSPSAHYDALVVVGFGAPERREDVLPFLERVTQGRRVPRERLLEVASHYEHFGGVSPLNEQVRQLVRALRGELAERGFDLPVFWGNRNWHPLLEDTVREMARAGVRRALAFVLSAYGSYSSCRQYLEAIDRACRAAGPDAPRVDKLRLFYNHPLFIQANADRLRAALSRLPDQQRATAHVAFTAHSLPLSLARTCDYVQQLEETCRLTAEAVGVPAERWRLVYQSRSGRPQDPWLEPDILDHLTALRRQGVTAVVVAPVGFLSDHLEVLYDLDVQAAELAERLGLAWQRAGTVGVHPLFVRMVGELVAERVEGAPRRAVGRFPPHVDVCPPDCCPAPRRPAP